MGWQHKLFAVTGYRVDYGGAIGNYANSVTVGNVTIGAVSRLAGGSTDFFAVAVRNASELENDHSNGIT